MVAIAMNDLHTRYMKDGKDQSDIYRGFITALKQVMMIKDGLKNIDVLREQAKEAQKGVR